MGWPDGHMVWPGGHGLVYSMAWLAGMTWYMVWPVGNGMVYDMTWRTMA